MVQVDGQRPVSRIQGCHAHQGRPPLFCLVCLAGNPAAQQTQSFDQRSKVLLLLLRTRQRRQSQSTCTDLIEILQSMQKNSWQTWLPTTSWCVTIKNRRPNLEGKCLANNDFLCLPAQEVIINELIQIMPPTDGRGRMRPKVRGHLPHTTLDTGHGDPQRAGRLGWTGLGHNNKTGCADDRLEAERGEWITDCVYIYVHKEEMMLCLPTGSRFNNHSLFVHHHLWNEFIINNDYNAYGKHNEGWSEGCI